MKGKRVTKLGMLVAVGLVGDINGNTLGCQDLPVAYTITAP